MAAPVTGGNTDRAMDQIFLLTLQTSLVLALVGVGLQSRWSDLIYALSRPMLVLRAVVAVNLIVPLAAVLLVELFPLEPVVKAGIILMAVSPLAPAVPARMLKVGATPSFTVGLYVVLVLLSIIIVPSTLAILSSIYPVDVRFAPEAAARLVISSILMPLLIGILVGAFFPAIAKRALKPARVLSSAGLLLCLVLITTMMWDEMTALLGNGALLVILLTIAAGLLAGRLLGGPGRNDRAALSAAAALRHPGLAGAIIAENFAGRGIEAVTMLFLLASVLTTTIYFAANKARGPAGIVGGRPI
jgi:BASS family bile acid:Na+ symporter